MSNPAVLRRYTPPTCTLEILAQQSPLSRWAGQTVLKNIRFRLHLDDPTRPEAEQITLKGDRTQLAALSDTVTTYVHGFLQQSGERLDWYFAPTRIEANGEVEPEVGSELESGPTTESERVSESWQSAASAEITIAETEQVAPLETGDPIGAAAMSLPETDLRLTPNSVLSHTLTLGSLAPNAETIQVKLSTLQLFDLANALEDYTAEALTLPNLQRPQLWRSPPHWGAIAAGTLIAIGVSTSLLKLLDGTYRSPTITASQGVSSADQRIATQLPPSVVQKTTPPIVSTQTLPPLPTTTVPASPNASLPQVPVNPTGPSAGSSNAPPIASKPIQQPGTVTLNPPTVQIDALPKGNAATKPEGEPSAADTQIAAAPNTTLSEGQLAAEGEATSSRSGSPGMKAAPSAAVTAPRSPAIDVSEQITEARTLMEQRWKPPEGLTQSLQYSLVIDGNGSIKSIFPLGTAAGTYVDRTGLPLPGESFVKAAPGGQSFNLRLVLEPDGKVQVLSE